MRDRRTWIRQLSVILASAVLMLALILVVAVCGGMTADDPPAESDYHFVPSLPDGTFDPSEWFSDWTRPDIEPNTREPGTWDPGTWDPGIDTREPSTGFGTAPDWLTLPPEPSTAPEPEWPTLPEGWDTLPDGWDTLPSEWGDVTLSDLGEIGDILAGMNGSLQNPAGALGAGVAAQLTMFKVNAEIDDTVYFKMQSFGAYNGTGWNAAHTSPYLLGDSSSADYLAATYLMYSQPLLPKYTLGVTKVMDVDVMPYYLIAMSGGNIASDVLVSEGLDDQDWRCFIYCHAEEGGNDPLPDWFTTDENKYAAYAREIYIDLYDSELDLDTKAYIDEIIRREGFDASDPAIIDKVAQYVMQAATYNINYDKRLDSEENIALAFLGGYREGVCRHFATAATLIYRRLGIPARYTVGFRADVRGGGQADMSIPTIAGGPVTEVKGKDAHAWVEVYREGEGWICVEVTPPPTADERIELTLQPANISRVYIPGTPLEPTGEIVGFEKFTALGYSYDVSVHGARTEPGVNESVIQFIRIFDPDGRDVTDYFRITLLPGRVQVYRAELLFGSDSLEQVYNGQALELTAEHCGLMSMGGQLPEDGRRYRVEITPTGSRRDVGTSLSTFRVTIWVPEETTGDGDMAENWVDVTDEFRIRRSYGTLTVTPMALTVKLADQSKVYDGNPLTAAAEMDGEPALVPGDMVALFRVEGSQTVVGRSESHITDFIICNEAGEDVTRNYRITFVPGTLQVLAE